MEAMIDWTNPDVLLTNIGQWLEQDVLVWSTLAQLAVIVAIALAARALAVPARRIGEQLAVGRMVERYARPLTDSILLLTFPLIGVILFWVAITAADQLAWPRYLISIVASLLTAWIIIRFASRLVRDNVWSRLVAAIAWSLAALNILGLLGPAAELFDSWSVQFGAVRLSALALIEGLFVLVVLLWLAMALSATFDRRIQAVRDLTPSVQVLLGKVLKIVLVVIAVVAALGTLGIDLTAFAIFTGAVGIGIGLGLQKVVSNLVSGMSLLLDRSIKPGDVIEIEGTYGWINAITSRYVSVITRDGKEILIPNEDLITQRVTNWSYSHNLVRLRVTIGIHYNSDVRRAIELCLDAAKATPRVLADPAPNCFIEGFGDSSVDLSLRYWIDDPADGVSNVRGDILLNVWDRFHEHEIEIPFPQRDLHLKSPGELTVSVKRNGPTGPQTTSAEAGS